MPKWHWQELNLLQMYDILRGVEWCRLAVEEDGRPWCVPMHFQFEIASGVTYIHLTMPDHGRKLDAMALNDRVCLEFELPGCAWLDVLVATGRATVGLYMPGELIHLRVRVLEMSARRFFPCGDKDWDPEDDGACEPAK